MSLSYLPSIGMRSLITEYEVVNRLLTSFQKKGVQYGDY